MKKEEILDCCEIILDDEDESYKVCIGERVVTEGGFFTYLTAVLTSEDEGDAEPSLWITEESIYDFLLSGEPKSLATTADEGFIENSQKAPFLEDVHALFEMVKEKAIELK